MKKLILLSFVLILPLFALAQTGLSCQTPITLTNLAAYCSANNAYNNSNAAQAGITWFTFRATHTVVNVVANSSGGNGELTQPNIKLYAACNTAALTATKSSTANVATLHAQALAPGSDYLIAVSGQNTGKFKLCLNNYDAPSTDGQDCETALNIYDTQDIGVSSFIGLGLKPHESFGTCLAGFESNTTWYKWKAANSGSLVFTLIPTIPDNDIDFVLYDLGLTSDCSGVTAANAIRCSAGHGICPVGPNYSQTGLDFAATDVSEASGCDLGQDGKVKYADMVAGHNYGLLVSNFSGSTGFTLKFADQNGKPGTATFAAPDLVLNVVPPTCSSSKTYIFDNYLTIDHAFNWDFGPGATILDVDANFNFTVQYATPGIKSATLTVYNALGSPQANQVNIDVPDVLPPAQPIILANKAGFCLGDDVILSTTPVPGLTYAWTGPNNFTSADTKITIPVTANYVAGTYNLIAVDGNCKSVAGSFTTVIGLNPVAAFTASPKFTAEILIPATVSFINQSAGADSYLWDFGDGNSAIDANPTHTYTANGTYHVKLTAFNTVNSCSASVTEGDYIVKYGNKIFIPNAFTPNNDGINDLFAVSITNTRVYHMQVFNRNGSVVFDSRNAQQTWDGNYKNTPVPVGTYYYLIDATGLDNNVIKQSGYVSVIR